MVSTAQAGRDVRNGNAPLLNTELERSKGFVLTMLRSAKPEVM